MPAEEAGMPLEKAVLICHDDKNLNIEFMYNPKHLSLKLEVKTDDNSGARSQTTGRPKISFSNLPPKVVTINDILFDTYETHEDVIETYLQPFYESANFLDGKERPPVYLFSWGKTILEYCFVEVVDFKLTKFLADGTAVRAIVNTLTLKETERPEDAPELPKAEADPANDNTKIRS